MKALTVCQPFASLISNGLKWIENRTWITDHRGILAIHAGKSLKYYESANPPPPHVPLGAIVAVCTVRDIFRLDSHNAAWCLKQPLEISEHAEGPFCWLLVNIVKLPHVVHCRGQRLVWTMDLETRQQVYYELQHGNHCSMKNPMCQDRKKQLRWYVDQFRKSLDF